MFFFRTQYEQGSRKRPSEGITPAPGNTYMSYVLAKDEQEALVKMSNRNLNERFTSYCDPTPLEDVKPREVLKFLQKPTINIWETDPDFPYGSYTHTLSVDELPKLNMSLNPVYTRKKLEPKDE